MCSTIIRKLVIALVCTSIAGITGGIIYENGTEMPYYFSALLSVVFVSALYCAMTNGIFAVDEIYNASLLHKKSNRWRWDTQERGWVRSIEVDDGLLIATVVRTDDFVFRYFSELYFYDGSLHLLDDKSSPSIQGAKEWCDSTIMLAYSQKDCF